MFFVHALFLLMLNRGCFLSHACLLGLKPSVKKNVHGKGEEMLKECPGNIPEM